MNSMDRESFMEKLDPAFRSIVKWPESPSERPCLIGKRCRDCGQYSIGNRIICANCHSEELEETPIGRKGILYSYSISRVVPMGFPSPLIIGLVDLPEGLRIWSQIETDSEESLRIGIDVEMTVGRVRLDEENNEIWGYRFRPARSEERDVERLIERKGDE